MIKTNWMKKLLTALLSVLLVAAVAVSIPGATTADAADIAISNANFSSYGTSDYSPSGWSFKGDSNKEVFSGVFNGDYDKEKHGFENADKLVARDGKTTKDFLLINSNDVVGGTYSCYSSTSVTLDKSSFYQFVAWAKAEVTNDNAYVIVSGLDEDVYLPVENDGEWHIYKIYLATNSIASKTVTVDLSFGKDGAKASGYAMFDDVSVESLDVKDFADIAESENVLVKDFRSEYIGSENPAYIYGGDFTTLDYTKWTVNNASYVKTVPATGRELVNDKTLFAPNYDGNENSVLQISNNGEDTGVYASVTSHEFTIEMNKYYRISYFVLDAGETDTTVGATATLHYKYATNQGDFIALPATNVQIANDSYKANDSHYGWIERSFFVKGSAYADITAKIELALGQNELNTSKGVVLFDDVRVQVLDVATYTAAATDTSVIANADSAISDSTGVTNGGFGSFTDNDGVLVPTSWTLTTPSDSDVACYGFSSAVVNNDAFTYEAIREVPATLNSNKLGFTLKMASEEKTAVALRSSAITVSASSYGLVTVNLATLNVDGYGASIVLRKVDGSILGKIENITDTKFDKYSFCVKAGTENVVFNVELWLGLNDRNKNMDKLSSGEIYVDSVSYATSDEATYTTYANGTNAKTVAVNGNVADAWIAFDNDSHSAEKPLYNWVVYQSVADSDHSNGVTYTAVKDGEEDVVKLTNIAPNASAIVLNTEHTIAASSYYKVTMQIKIEGSLDDTNGTAEDNSVIENYRGAWAGVIIGSETYLSTPYTVKDIKKTTDELGANEYLTLEFFVQAGESESSLYLFVALGEDIEIAEDSDEEEVALTRGSVYVKGITVEESNTTEYTNAENDLGKYQVLVDLLGDTTDEEEGNDEEESTSGVSSETIWMLLASIALGVALIALILILSWKKITKKLASKKKTVVGKASYDRANLTANDDNEIKTEKDKDAPTSTVPGELDSFDDENAPAEETPVENAPAEEPAEEAPVEEAPVEETATEEAPAEEAEEKNE